MIPEHGGLEGAGVTDVACGDDELRSPFCSDDWVIGILSPEICPPNSSLTLSPHEMQIDL